MVDSCNICTAGPVKWAQFSFCFLLHCYLLKERLAKEFVSSRNLVTPLSSLKDIIHLLLERIYFFPFKGGPKLSQQVWIL